MKLFPFEECYLVNLVERPDRLEYMQKQFKELNCEDEIILHRAVKHPDWVMEIFKKSLNKNDWYEKCKSRMDVPHSTSGCLEQYSIIKSAYLRGVKTLLIIEDDCGLIKDRSVLEEYFNNLPTDWDVLRINCLRGQRTQDYINDFKDEYSYWYPQINSLWGAGAYALSRNGMKYMLDWFDMYFDAIDVPLAFGNTTKKISNLEFFEKTDTTGVKFYIPAIPLGLCSEMSLESDLHKDLINAGMGNTMYNFFEKIKEINRNDYF